MGHHRHCHKSIVSHHFSFDDAKPSRHYDVLGCHQIVIIIVYCPKMSTGVPPKWNIDDMSMGSDSLSDTMFSNLSAMNFYF